MSRHSMCAAFISLALAAGLFGGQVRGQVGGQVAAQPATNDALSAARELIAVMRATDQLKQMLPTIMQALKPAIAQGRPQVEEALDALMPVLLDGMSSRVGEFTDQMASVYAHNFTPDEMRQMVVFYRGPVGQKFLEKMPIVMQESMSLGQAFGQKVAGELQSRMIEELQKKGLKP